VSLSAYQASPAPPEQLDLFARMPPGPPTAPVERVRAPAGTPGPPPDPSPLVLDGLAGQAFDSPPPDDWPQAYEDLTGEPYPGRERVLALFEQSRKAGRLRASRPSAGPTRRRSLPDGAPPTAKREARQA
jgi:hypothetical protein